ncbi:MAG: hypothetical protein QNJ85_04360, partial [Gammaproteobacteria bacterium]|nr:hypothetical protein [Gammaproteobacteria bacterium]
MERLYPLEKPRLKLRAPVYCGSYPSVKKTGRRSAKTDIGYKVSRLLSPGISGRTKSDPGH